MDVIGKVALVTGGGRGIGEGIVSVLARNGADVAVSDINLENAHDVAEKVSHMGRSSMAVRADVTDQASVDELVHDVLERFEHIDILVNNAGVIGGSGYEGGERETDEDWDLTHNVNVRGTARVTDAVKPHMIERRYGKIVNIASIAARQGSFASAAYGASKAGVMNFTQSMATQLAPFNINVNAICPGMLWTPMWQRIAVRYSKLGTYGEGMSDKDVFDTAIKERIPLGRPQTPEDVGNAVAFLASEYAKNITGQSLNVSGGLQMN